MSVQLKQQNAGYSGDKKNDPGLDSEAFERLHANYSERLLDSLTTMVRDRASAEEIAAEAFAKALKHRASFRAVSSEYTWLQAIARHTAFEKQHRRRTVPLENLDDRPALDEDALEALEKQEAVRRVRQALARIPAIHRRVLKARFLQGESTRQVAKRERIPFGTVLSRVAKAKQLLRERLEATP
jgi:RNA polymerase sigma-70 factor (ECF subfamily)